MTSSQLSTSKHGAVGHYPISTPLRPLTSMSSDKKDKTVPVLSSHKNVLHRPEDRASNLQERDQSSASAQQSVSGSTLSETVVPFFPRGRGHFRYQSDFSRAMNNQPTFDGGFSYHTSEPQVQYTPTVFKTEGDESVTQREEGAKSSEDQFADATEEIDPALMVTELPYRGLMLPAELFEPAKSQNEDIPEDPELLHLSSMDNLDLSYYLQTLRTVCDCDGFNPSEPCPLHGRGHHSLKRWTNDLLDAYTLYWKNRLCTPTRKLLISTDTSTPSDESQDCNRDLHFSSSKDVSAIHPHTPVEPSYTGKLKDMMRERLQEYNNRVHDSGLVPRTNRSPPSANLLEKSDGSVTKAKKLALEATKQSSRDKTLEKSSSSLREKLEKLRKSNPTTEVKQDTPVFKKPPPRHHAIYMGRPRTHKGSELKNTSNNPLSTSQASAHEIPRVPKIVKVAGKPAVEDVSHPKQRYEYRQKDTHNTPNMRKAVKNDTSRQQAAIAHTTQRLVAKDSKQSKLSQTTSPQRLAVKPADQQCRGLVP